MSQSASGWRFETSRTHLSVPEMAPAMPRPPGKASAC
eukprot:CAMPEP_0196653502 /NCGR_PEP_ID=MMETSP1086-20130531/3150_1 /TAXON_ID=77921 /ORGANISM="Cyanoptyche  gloeocystis , Strain SAG4.97" /LENGTH=36 /DNA_ID= /DNA_START= /DNA_END= /DNA_ORIENTATION=